MRDRAHGRALLAELLGSALLAALVIGARPWPSSPSGRSQQVRPIRDDIARRVRQLLTELT